jgi:hypothetical protein
MNQVDLQRLKDNISEYGEDERFERPFENGRQGYRNNPFVPMSCFGKQWTKNS